MKIALGVGTILAAALCAAQPAIAQQEHLVFVCNRDGADNICVTDSSASEIRQITFGKEKSDSKGGPRWSRDHQKVAFHLKRKALDCYGAWSHDSEPKVVE